MRSLLDELETARERDLARLRRQIVLDTVLAWQICSQVVGMLGAGEGYPGIEEVLKAPEPEPRGPSLEDEARAAIAKAERIASLDRKAKRRT